MEGTSADIQQLKDQFQTATAAVVAAAPADYTGFSKTELKYVCAEHGLPTSGTKAELIARLEEG